MKQHRKQLNIPYIISSGTEEDIALKLYAMFTSIIGHKVCFKSALTTYSSLIRQFLSSEFVLIARSQQLRCVYVP